MAGGHDGKGRQVSSRPRESRAARLTGDEREDPQEADRQNRHGEVEERDRAPLAMSAGPDACEEDAALESLGEKRPEAVKVVMGDDGGRLEAKSFASLDRPPAEDQVAQELVVRKPSQSGVERPGDEQVRGRGAVDRPG